MYSFSPQFIFQMCLIQHTKCHFKIGTALPLNNSILLTSVRSHELSFDSMSTVKFIITFNNCLGYIMVAWRWRDANISTPLLLSAFEVIRCITCIRCMFMLFIKNISADNDFLSPIPAVNMPWIPQYTQSECNPCS